MAFIFTDANFAEETKTGVSLVDFWAPWCGPCQMLWPIIEEVAKDFEWKAKIWKMNVDENSEIPKEFWVMWIPAIKIFKDWELVEEITWFVPKETLVESLEKHI